MNETPGGSTKRWTGLRVARSAVTGPAVGPASASSQHLLPAPDVTESERTASFRLLTLEALVRMKLTSFRDKDRMHTRDLIDVGLVDASWISRLDSRLGARLKQLLDNPEG